MKELEVTLESSQCETCRLFNAASINKSENRTKAKQKAVHTHTAEAVESFEHTHLPDVRSFTQCVCRAMNLSQK